jgi:hypothetical protein
MSHHGRRFLSRDVPLLLLVFFCLTAASDAQTPAATPTPDNKVPVKLTIDPKTFQVTASPDPVALHFENREYAEWRIDPAGAALDFTIGIEDQKDPKKRKPAKKLPTPKCSGTGAEKHCKSIIPTKAHKGDQKYSVTVNGVKTDPEVTIDP